jgi:AraC-like DNA-binding protein
VQAIPLSWARRQCAGAAAGGLPLDALLERAFVDVSRNDDRVALSPAQLTLLYATLVLDTEDEAHALSRRPIAPGYGSLAFRILFGSETLEAGIEGVTRLYGLSASTMQIRLDVAGDMAFLAIRYDDEDSPSALLLEDCYIAYLFMGLSQFVDRPFPVAHVVTRDPLHMNIGALHWSTRAPVRLGGVAGLAFPRAVLASRQVASPQEDLRWQAFQRWLDFVEPDPVESLSPLANIRSLRVDRMAAAQTLSPRAYREISRVERGGFRQFRRETLTEAGVDLLVNGKDSVDAVAAQLGYSDARSFRRFIKTATGRTPDQIRSGFQLARRNLDAHARLRDVIARMPG